MYDNFPLKTICNFEITFLSCIQQLLTGGNLFLLNFYLSRVEGKKGNNLYILSL